MQANQMIFQDVAIYKGVSLDKMIEVGPRGGTRVYWRAACKRDYQVATWSHTKRDAALTAPGYKP